MESFSINFDIELCDTGLNNAELSGICKHLMLQWYDETYKNKVNMSNLEQNIGRGIEPLLNEVKQLYGSNKSAFKGQIFENIIEQTLHNNFPHYTYDNTGKVNHCGDGYLTSPTGMKAVVEMKNYSTTVGSAQINKLKYDMQNTGIKNALLLSAYTGIQGKKLLDIETFLHEGSKYNIVHVSKYMENEYKIQIAITILEHLYEKSNLVYIEEELIGLNELIDSMSKLKSQYLTMEKGMRESMDAFYLGLRDTEYNMKKQITSILSNIQQKQDMISEDIVHTINNPLLSYMNDTQLTKYGFNICKETEYCICKNNKKYGNIKFVGKRIDLIFTDLETKISITQNNKSISEKLLESILQSYEL